MAVYHLHGETGWSTVVQIKIKLSDGKFRSGSLVTIYFKTPIYRETLRHIRPDHNSKMELKNCKW